VSFGLLGIQIRVAPSFLIFQMGLAAYITVTLPTSGALKLLAVALIGAVVFISVIVHEMGHALAARRAGLDPEVTLTWFGGFTQFVANVGPGRRLWISAAGVVYQAAMAGIVWVLIQQGLFVGEDLPKALAEAFVWFNLVMAGVNLIPIGGMDGGAILGSVLELLRVPRPRLVLLIIYGLGGAALTIWALAASEWVLMFVGLYITYAGVRGQTPQVRYELDARANPDLEATLRRLLLTHRFDEAAGLARQALETIDSKPYKVFTTSVLLDSLRLGGSTEALADVLAHLDADGVDQLTLGLAYAAAGEAERAAAILTSLLTESGDATAAEELAGIYLSAGNPEAAAAVVGYRPDLFHPLRGLHVHHRLVGAGAMDAARAVRELMSAQRDVRPGSTAHMLIAEGLVEEGLAILQRDHALSANRASAAWLDHGLSMAGLHESAVQVRSEELPGSVDPEGAHLLVDLLTDRGEHERAVDVGLPAIENAGRLDDSFLYAVAKALDAAGRADDAVELLGRTSPLFLLRNLTEEPDFPKARHTAGFVELVEMLATAQL
jgi:Zn-dependent protease/tetratricopeptide (TPR) repeat protein